MNFICPHCSNNAFRLLTEHVGAQHAECIRCGEIIPFAKSEMEPRNRAQRGRPAFKAFHMPVEKEPRRGNCGAK